MKKKHILIIGGYGCRNYGDEAILAGILEKIKMKENSPVIEVLAHDPREIMKFHHVKGISLQKLLLHFWSYNQLLIGGGTIFRKDMRLRAQLLPCFALVAKLFRKEVLFYSLGIDRDTPSLARFFLVHAMNISDLVSVREKDSAKILRDWGVRKDIQIIKDPAIDLEKELLTEEQLLALHIDPKKKKIGVSLRNLHALRDVPHLEEFVSLFKKLTNDGYQVIFFPFCSIPFNPVENDLLLGEYLEKRVGHPHFILLKDELSPRALKGLVFHMDIMLAMRLHAMIFAVSTKTPLIGLSYSQKCDSFLEEYKQVKFPVKNIPFQELSRLLERSLN